jgi:hypothetical protein
MLVVAKSHHGAPMTLTRKSPMPRTEFKRGPRPVGILAQASFAKVRARRCAICREPFTPARPSAKVCGPKCAEAFGIAAGLKAERKSERKSDAARKDALKRRADWLAETQVAFNAWVRYRDRDLPCICCGKSFPDSDLPGGAWDAGHYLSRGHAPHLRYDERNVHRQVKGHNRPGGTTRESFRRGMVARIGLEAVEALEADDTPRKYTVDELRAIKALYEQKLKQLREK